MEGIDFEGELKLQGDQEWCYIAHNVVYCGNDNTLKVAKVDSEEPGAPFSLSGCTVDTTTKQPRWGFFIAKPDGSKMVFRTATADERDKWVLMLTSAEGAKTGEAVAAAPAPLIHRVSRTKLRNSQKNLPVQQSDNDGATSAEQTNPPKQDDNEEVSGQKKERTPSIAERGKALLERKLSGVFSKVDASDASQSEDSPGSGRGRLASLFSRTKEGETPRGSDVSGAVPTEIAKVMAEGRPRTDTSQSTAPKTQAQMANSIPTMTGKLHKQSRKFGKWDDRWFTLYENDTISYSSTESAAAAKFLPAENCQVTRLADVRGKLNCFRLELQVNGKMDSYVLSPEQDKELDDWFDAFEKVKGAKVVRELEEGALLRDRLRSGDAGSISLALPRLPKYTPKVVFPIPEETISKRDRIAKEILETEQQYVRHLQVLVNMILKTLRLEPELLSPQQVPLVFVNVESIYQFNNTFLGMLEDRIKDWNDTTMIGDIFKKNAPFFKLYTEFCDRFDKSRETLTACIEANRLLSIFTQACRMRPECDNLDLFSFLIMPVQRLPRYVMLLTDLIKKTEDSHPDKKNLEGALKETKKAADHINEWMQKSHAFQNMNSQIEDFQRLLKHDRVLVKEMKLWEKGSHVGDTKPDAVLFTDIVALTVLDPASSKLRVSKIIDIHSGEFTRADPAVAECQVRTPETTIEIIANSAADMDTFMTLAEQQKNVLKDKHTKPEYRFKDGCVYAGQWEDCKMHGTAERYVFADGATYKGGMKNGRVHGSGVIELSNGTTYEGNFRNDQCHGEGKVLWNGEEQFVGHFEEGQRCGKGKLTLPHGDIYEGDFVANIALGSGKLTFANGCVYEGQFFDDKRHGLGSFNGKDSYEGQWVNDMREGEGVLKKRDESVYKGEFKRDQRHGKGTFTEVDGSLYEGAWSNDRRDGEGKQVYADGGCYEGQWEIDLKHGKGKLVTPDGSVYEGDFIDGVREGMGTLTTKEGSVYEGGWYNDMRDGSGTLKLPDGTKMCGEWLDDQLDGENCEIIYPNGTEYHGSMVKGKRSGNGVETRKDGACYIGEWKRGFRIVGSQKFADGSSYSGDFKRNEFHGRGVHILSDGKTEYDGEWEFGRKHGHGLYKSIYGTFNGGWAEDRMHGEGIFEDQFGLVWKGVWEDGRKHGNFEVTNPKTHTVTTISFVQGVASNPPPWYLPFTELPLFRQKP